MIVLSQSAHEVVVFKPAGVASEFAHEHAADHADASMRAQIARQFPGTSPKLPHRLDRVTRGILLACLTSEAIAFQNEEAKARHWEKYYLARVAPAHDVAPQNLLGEHKAFLTENNGRARVVTAGGKPAFMTILAAAAAPEQRDRWQLLLKLTTGRFHQIRVMCAALGLPLAGDPLYDPGARDADEFYLEHIVFKYTPFATQTRATIFRAYEPTRGALAEPIARTLNELVDG